MAVQPNHGLAQPASAFLYLPTGGSTLLFLPAWAHFDISKLCFLHTSWALPQSITSLLNAYSLSTLVVYHLHTDIHQHLWKMLEISPTTMLDVLIFQFHAGVDGLK